MASANEVARYRAETANLLAKSAATTRELERWLDVTGGWARRWRKTTPPAIRPPRFDLVRTAAAQGTATHRRRSPSQ